MSDLNKPQYTHKKVSDEECVPVLGSFIVAKSEILGFGVCPYMSVETLPLS